MKPIFLSLLLVALTSCATQYQPKSFSGGFSETQLAENVFKVSFEGNGYTDTERSSDFALLRSAEITIENKYKYFALADSQSGIKTSSFTTPVTAHTTGYSNSTGTLNMYGNNGYYSGSSFGSSTTTFSGGDTFFINKPSSNYLIVCYKKKPKDTFVFDAKIIQESLKKKYQIQ